MPPERQQCTNTVVIQSNQHGQILDFHPEEGPISRQCLQQGNDYGATIARYNHQRLDLGFHPENLNTNLKSTTKNEVCQCHQAPAPLIENTALKH
jgi:hypothetical protein